MKRALVIAALLAPGAAAAHGLDVYPEQYELLAEPGPAPQRLILGTTYGLVLSSDGGATWRWACESAFGVNGSWAPEYELTAGGAITATTMSGLQITRDGCTWTAATGPAGARTAAATARGGDGTLWLASIDDGAQVRRSPDDGTTWIDAAPLPGVLWVTRLAVAPSDPTRLYVSGDFYEGAVRTPRLWRSTDGAASWAPLPTESMAIGPDTSLHVVAIDPADPERLFVRATSTAAALEERLYRSIDGGDTWTEVLRVNDHLTGVVARADGTVVAGTPMNGLFRSTDGGAGFDPIDAPRRKVTCLAELGDHRLYQCADNFTPDNMGLGRSDDGAAWTKVMTMSELVGPLACPAGTIQQDECRQGTWCYFKQTYAIASDEVSCGAPDVDVMAPDPPVCGCGSGGAGASTGLGLGLVVGLVIRRRRR